MMMSYAAAVMAAGMSVAGLPDPFEAGWNGEPVCEKLVEDEAQRILRCSFPPGIGHERHFHAPHTGYVLEGGLMQITDEDGTRTVEVTAGSTWKSDAVTVHEVVNVGDTTARFLIFEIRARGNEAP